MKRLSKTAVLLAVALIFLLSLLFSFYSGIRIYESSQAVLKVKRIFTDRTWDIQAFNCNDHLMTGKKGREKFIASEDIDEIVVELNDLYNELSR